MTVTKHDYFRLMNDGDKPSYISYLVANYSKDQYNQLVFVEQLTRMMFPITPTTIRIAMGSEIKPANLHLNPNSTANNAVNGIELNDLIEVIQDGNVILKLSYNERYDAGQTLNQYLEELMEKFNGIVNRNG